jgi:hypothetical protein
LVVALVVEQLRSLLPMVARAVQAVVEPEWAVLVGPARRDKVLGVVTRRVAQTLPVAAAVPLHKAQT